MRTFDKLGDRALYWSTRYYWICIVSVRRNLEWGTVLIA